jgi:cell division protein FtsW
VFKRLRKDDTSDVLDRVVPVFGPGQRTSTVQKPFDVYLFVTTLLLVLIGILMVFSSSAILAKDNFGDTNYFLKRQLTFLGIGLCCLYTVKSIPYRLYAKFIYPLLGGVFFLMLLSFIPGLSHSAKGATRWINIFGFTLQPSEFAKVVVIIFSAYLISKKGLRIRDFKKGFVPVIGVAGLFILMILAQKDLGTASVLIAVIFILLAVAGTRMSYLGGAILAAIPALYVLIFSEAFRRARIMAFLDPWKYQLDKGFQIIQSFVAFNSGGFGGVGLGESKQKLFYLPEAHTDFIFSVLAEEFGMIGVVLVMTLFLIFIYHGLEISKRARDPFGALLALGITCLIGLQAFINFAVVMGILPTKGLALPFISYGGSSLIASLVAVGILLNISTETEAEAK